MKEKICKCQKCGRWIANPVYVGEKVFGKVCAKKERIEIAVQKSKDIEIEPTPIKIKPIKNLPSAPKNIDNEYNLTRKIIQLKLIPQEQFIWI